MKRIAVLGAGGFIGNRTVEMIHGGGAYEVVPVVRRPSALALAKRFPIGGKIADALDQRALAEAFAGCDAVVAAVAGPPATVTGMAAPLVKAAQAAGVRRIVYLSSQMVHGQAPAPGTTEDSPPPRRQPFEYNRAKAAAERTLRRLSAAAALELTILRPGIVYGPRSRWTGKLADELLAGEGFLVSDVPSACNAIFVDNLVHAIVLAVEAPKAAGQAFFINDAEALTWTDLIEPIAGALGIAREAIARPTLSEATRIDPLWSKRRLRSISRPAIRLLPHRARQILRVAHRAALAPVEKRGEVGRSYSREMALLQSCAVRLSDALAREDLGYRPPISYVEGMRRSIAWLRFAGYPVR